MAIPDEVLRSNPLIPQMIAQRAMQTGSGVPAPGPASAVPQPDFHIQVNHGLGEAPAPIPQQPTEVPQARALQSAPPITPLAKTQPTPKSPGEAASEAEVGRLAGSKAGWEQIHNPVLKVLAGIGNAVGSGLFPNIAAAIPGTSVRHQLLLHNAEGALKNQAAERESVDTGNLKAAQATEQGSLPAFHEAQNDVKRLTAENAAARDQANIAERGAFHEGQNEARMTQADAALHREGYRRTPEGDIEPIPYEQMSPEQQVNHDLKSSQRELADATAALRKAQAEKNPQGESLAMQRLDIANRRLALSQATYNARYLGTDTHGAPLPGAMLTDENKPVGSVNAPNVRPTGTQRTRGNLATSGEEQLNDMRAIVQRHPEFFGPGAGRATAFQKWIGSQDPEAQRFLTAREILADHATGVFGARSEGAIAAQRIASGELKDNPEAIVAALGQMEKAMKNIGKQGVVKTVGSHAEEETTAIPYTDAGKTYNIPANQEKEFLRDHPGAKKANAR